MLQVELKDDEKVVLVCKYCYSHIYDEPCGCVGIPNRSVKVEEFLNRYSNEPRVLTKTVQEDEGLYEEQVELEDHHKQCEVCKEESAIYILITEG